MLNEILDGITNRLDELFSDCRIYTDAVKQDFKEPCFFVQFLEPSEKPMIGRRYFRQTGAVIQYFPRRDSRRERNEVLDRLMDGMEFITLADGRRILGVNRKGREEDGNLTFFVEYNTFGLKAGPVEEAMEEIKWKGEVE